MLTRTKKIFLTLFLSIFLLTNLSIPLVKAQWYTPEFDEFTSKVFDPNEPTEIFGERYTYAQVVWIIWSLAAFITGSKDDLQNCLYRNGGVWSQCTAYFDEIPQLFTYSGTDNNSLPQAVKATIFAQRPISGFAYLANVKDRLKLVPEAKAQGFGFTAATPVLELWRQVRNLSYFLLVIVVIAMAFMIMFRTRISPQTVITVQSALPRIFLALILITFSYAIAGFIIDLMYVAIGLIATVLTEEHAISQHGWNQMFTDLTGRPLLLIMGQYFIMAILALIAALLSSGLIGAAATGAAAALLVTPIGQVLGILLLVVFAIYFLVITIKILWMLLRNFVIVLLLVIFGPLQILLGTIAGGGFGRWLRAMIAHLAVFPLVGFMFVMSFVFLRGGWCSFEGTAGTPILNAAFPFGVKEFFAGDCAPWAPPFIGAGVEQASTMELVWVGVSIVIMSMVPKAGKLTQAFIAGGRFDLGSEIGHAVGAPMGVAATPISYPVSRTAGGISRAIETGMSERASQFAGLDFVVNMLRRKKK